MQRKEGKSGNFRDINRLKNEFSELIEEFKKKNKLGNYDIVDLILKGGNDEFDKLIKDFKQKNKLSQYDLIDIVVREEEIQEKPDLIPTYIFDNEVLSCFEAIVKFLRERLYFPNKKIAKLLDRSQSTIACTYANANKKMSVAFIPKHTDFFVPISSVADRRLSVLETIVKHLKENYNLNYHKVAMLLNRNDRTIWTVYQRAIKKNA